MFTSNHKCGYCGELITSATQHNEHYNDKQLCLKRPEYRQANSYTPPIMEGRMKATKEQKLVQGQVYVQKESGGTYIQTKEDGTLQDVNDPKKRYQLVEVEGKDCRKADSKPSSYTHAGAMDEARRQLANAQSATCAADQNKFLKRAQELIAHVESSTRQR